MQASRGRYSRLGIVGPVVLVLFMFCFSIVALSFQGSPVIAQAENVPLVQNSIIVLRNYFVPGATTSNDGAIASTTTTTNSNKNNNTTSSAFWYVGATTIDASSNANEGIRSYIQVENQRKSDGVLSFWISESFENNLWAQVGYYIDNGSAPVGFYQVWNLTGRLEVASGTTGVSDGTHLFSMQLVPQTNTWDFFVDNQSFASFDVRCNSSGSSYPIYAMSEEGYTAAPFAFNSVLFPSAIQIYKSGSWQSVSYGNSFGNEWGIAGHQQNPTLDQDEIAIGGSYPSLAVNSSLWT